MIAVVAAAKAETSNVARMSPLWDSFSVRELAILDVTSKTEVEAKGLIIAKRIFYFWRGADGR